MQCQSLHQKVITHGLAYLPPQGSSLTIRIAQDVFARGGRKLCLLIPPCPLVLHLLNPAGCVGHGRGFLSQRHTSDSEQGAAIPEGTLQSTVILVAEAYNQVPMWHIPAIHGCTTSVW